MANKKFQLEDGLPVTVYKRRNSRNLRLTVGNAGEVRVSVPAWAPYRAGLDFARSRRAWIDSQLRPAPVLADGQTVGKAHHLYFRVSAGIDKPAGRVSAGAVIVNRPQHMEPAHASVQKVAREASIRALRAQAEKLLPQRLAGLAARHGFEYSDVRIKQLKSRWGSCDQNGVISLSLYLMELPWEYIDYVLLHELTHTRVMRHGPDFWKAMQELLPDAKDMRRKLRAWQPMLGWPAAE